MNRIFILSFLFSILTHKLIAQHQFLFNTRFPGSVDAKVTYPDGTPAGSELKAQLIGGPAGTTSLQPLFPVTTFRTAPEPERFWGYVVPVDVYLPGLPGGDFATLQMRAYNGTDWENSLIRGESNMFTIQTARDYAIPLDGLQPFTVYIVPEPRTLAFVGVGLLCLVAFRWKKS